MKKNGMATAALVLGIVSLAGSLFGFGFATGLMGITFALLSRDHKMNGSALAGLIMSIVGTVVSGIILVLAFILAFAMVGFLDSPAAEDFLEEFNEYFEYYDEYYDDFEYYNDGSGFYFDFNIGNDLYNDPYNSYNNSSDYYEGGHKL